MLPSFKRPQQWPTPVWLSIAIAWLTVELFILGKYSLTIVGDNISFIPYLLSFYDNAIPPSDWTPFPAGGTDMLATGFSPLIFRWVYSLFPSWLAYQILAISPIAAAVIGMYGLCRRTFDFDRFTGIFAGFAYGIFHSREFYAVSGLAAYMPLAILTLSLLLDSKTTPWRWVALIAVGFLVAHTAYISRLFPWPAATFFIWFLFVERRRSFLDWGIIALFSFALMTSRWADIVSIVAYSKLSAISEFRNITDPGEILLSAASHLREEFSKHGYLPFIFIMGFIVSLFRGQQPKTIRVFTAIVAYIGLAFLATIGKIVLVHFLPSYSGFNVLHIMQNLPLFFVIAGAYAFQYLKNRLANESNLASNRAKSLRFTMATIVIFIIFQNGIQKFGAAKDWVSWGNFHQATQAPALKEQAMRIRESGMPIRALSFHMHGNLLNSYGLESIAGYHPLMSRRYRSFWWEMAGGWRLMPGWNDRFGHTDLGSMTSLLSIESRSEWLLKDFVNLNLLSLANAGLIVSRDKLNDPELHLISGPEQPWSSLTRNEKIQTNLKANFSAEKPLYIYRNLLVLPRAFSVEKLRVLDTDQQVLSALGEARLDELSRTAFASQSDLPPDFDKTTNLEVRTTTLSEYDGDRIVVDLGQSTGPTLLIVSNSYSPYWESFVDGIKTPIFPVDHTFWGVVIPTEAKQVVFKYQAPYRR